MALALHGSDTFKLNFVGITEDGGADLRFSAAYSLP